MHTSLAFRRELRVGEQNSTQATGLYHLTIKSKIVTLMLTSNKLGIYRSDLLGAGVCVCGRAGIRLVEKQYPSILMTSVNHQ